MSAYVSSFLYCENIQTQVTPQGTQYQIVNPLQQLCPIAIPGNYSFSISCTIAGMDLKEVHHFEAFFVSPDSHGKAKIFDFNLGGSILPAGDPIPEGFQINMDLRNMVIEQEGTYRTQIRLNNEILDEFKIEVKRQNRQVL